MENGRRYKQKSKVGFRKGRGHKQKNKVAFNRDKSNKTHAQRSAVSNAAKKEGFFSFLDSGHKGDDVLKNTGGKFYLSVHP